MTAKEGKKRSKTIQVKVELKQLGALVRVAQYKGTSISGYVYKILNEVLSFQEGDQERAIEYLANNKRTGLRKDAAILPNTQTCIAKEG